MPPSPKESFGLLPGRPICYSRIFVVFKGVHAFAAEGRLRFEGQKKEKPFSIPMCLWPQDPRSSKIRDRCFWGTGKYESIPGMIPKSNARECYLNDHASFFWFGWHRSRFKTGRIVLRNRLSNMNGFGTVLRETTVDKFLFLLAGWTGLLWFGLRTRFILLLSFINHKSHQSGKVWQRHAFGIAHSLGSCTNISTARVTPIG